MWNIYKDTKNSYTFYSYAMELDNVIYINDIDVNVSSSVHKVTDDTKLYSNVCTCDQTDHLQHDLDEMSEYST